MQPRNNNLERLIDSTFRNINRLFVISFKNMDGGSRRSSFDRYYMRLVEIKYFNVLIDNKQFLGHPVKKQKTRSIWQTYRNVKKWWLYNRELIWLFVSSKFLWIYRFRFAKTNKYEYSLKNWFCRKIRRRWWCKKQF